MKVALADAAVILKYRLTIASAGTKLAVPVTFSAITRYFLAFTDYNLLSRSPKKKYLKLLWKTPMIQTKQISNSANICTN